MTERDRLAADLAATCGWEPGLFTEQFWRDWADRLIALGWTRLDEGRMVVPKPHEGAHLVEVAVEVFADWMARTKDGKALTMEWGEPDEYGMYTPVWTMMDDGMVMVSRDAPLDEDRLARAALAHQRAEREAWAAKGEYGVIHVCGWHNTDCVAAIAKAYREDDGSRSQGDFRHEGDTDAEH